MSSRTSSTVRRPQGGSERSPQCPPSTPAVPWGLRLPVEQLLATGTSNPWSRPGTGVPCGQRTVVDESDAAPPWSLEPPEASTWRQPLSRQSEASACSNCLSLMVWNGRTARTRHVLNRTGVDNSVADLARRCNDGTRYGAHQPATTLESLLDSGSPGTLGCRDSPPLCGTIEKVG
jgi:hypothetical protein